MRHFLRPLILVVTGVLGLGLAQAGDRIHANAHDRIGLTGTLAELGLSGGSPAVEQAGSKHQGVAAEGYSKGSEKAGTLQNTHTVTVLNTVQEGHAVQGDMKTVDAMKGKTKTVQKTVTMLGVAPIAEAGTCDVVGKHITSTVVEHLTVTAAASVMPPVIQTVQMSQPAATSTVVVTHTVTGSPSQIAGNPAVVVESAPTVVVTSVQNAPAPAAPSVAVASSPPVASILGVGTAGQMVAGTGTFLGNGACDCMCLCSTGSFPTVAAVPQQPAQQATTFATSIVPQPTSVASGLLIDTSSALPAVAPSSVESSIVAAPSPANSAAQSITSPTQLSSAAPGTSLTSPSVAAALPTPESSPTSTQSSSPPNSPISSAPVAESAVLPSPLAATDPFSLQLTLAADPKSTNAAATAQLNNPIDIKTFSLTSALELGSLAQPTPA